MNTNFNFFSYKMALTNLNSTYVGKYAYRVNKENIRMNHYV